MYHNNAVNITGNLELLTVFVRCFFVDIYTRVGKITNAIQIQNYSWIKILFMNTSFIKLASKTTLKVKICLARITDLKHNSQNLIHHIFMASY